MKKTFLIIICILSSFCAFCQCLATFQDINNYVYVFDGGEEHYLEAMPLLGYKIGRANIMAYVGQN